MAGSETINFIHVLASEAAICQWWFDARDYSGIAIFILELPGVKSRFYASCPSKATLTKFRATF
jgi:hypothetical protein